MNRGFEGRSRGHLKTLARGREGTGRKEISLGRGGDPVSSGPGGGKDPWTEGAVSLGVINITDLCNLTHFRSPSATTTRSIFLPFLLLKPVHPTAFPLSFFSPRPFSIATQRVCVHLHHDPFLPSLRVQVTTKIPLQDHQRVVDARIFSYLWERLDIFTESIRSTGSKRDAHSQFSTRSEGFFEGSKNKA